MLGHSHVTHLLHSSDSAHLSNELICQMRMHSLQSSETIETNENAFPKKLM